MLCKLKLQEHFLQTAQSEYWITVVDHFWIKLHTVKLFDKGWHFWMFFLYHRAYEDLRVKHEPLLLITPQFETPLPPLQPAVN